MVLFIGMVMGLAHGLLITKLNLQPFVVTLCGLLIYRGIARFYTADATAGVPHAAASRATRPKDSDRLGTTHTSAAR